MSAQASKKNKGLGKFLKSTKAELKKVNWPTREEVKKNTMVVIVVCALAAAFLGFLDWIFGIGITQII